MQQECCMTSTLHVHFNTGECPAIEIDKAARRGQRYSDNHQKDHKTHETESASMTKDTTLLKITSDVEVLRVTQKLCNASVACNSFTMQVKSFDRARPVSDKRLYIYL
jgi:hypothetical protein